MASTESIDPARVRFVMVEPRSGGNVGAASRALKNLGFSRLLLVRPDAEYRGTQARRMAVSAVDLLERVEVHPSLDEALAGAASVIGTSCRTGKHRQPHYRLDQFTPEFGRLAATGEIAIVFGRENHGLSDDELDRCTHLVHFPASDEYASFNLAQSVLLVAYALRCTDLPPGPAPAQPAPHQEREAMYAHMREVWSAIGFLQPDAAEAIMRRFRRLYGRADLTLEEVRMLRGLARQTAWAARSPGREDDGGSC